MEDSSKLKVAETITPGNVDSLAKKQFMADMGEAGVVSPEEVAGYERWRTKPASLIRDGGVKDAITAASLAMRMKNMAAKSAGSAVDLLKRGTEATQASWLVWQDIVDAGKHPTENEILKRVGPKEYIKAAWKGRIEVTNDDLVKGMIGLELFNQFNGFKASPSSRFAANAVWLGTDAVAIGTGLAVGGPIGGFMAGLMTLPNHFYLDSLMRQRAKTGADPAIRVTDYMGMTADGVIDPMFALSFTPLEAFNNPLTRKLIHTAPVTWAAKPFKSILDSRAAGSLYAWIREPINVLPARIHRPIGDAVIDFQQDLKNHVGPMLTDLFGGSPVTTASAKLAYRQFTTRAGVKAAAQGGVVPATTNAAKLANLANPAIPHHTIELGGFKSKLPAGLAEFTTRGRRFVYDPAQAPANIEVEINDILSKRVGVRDLGNDILLQRAMGWTDADINKNMLLKNHSLAKVNHAWATTLGSQPYATTKTGKVSKVLSQGLPEWIRGGDFDQRVGMYIAGKETKRIFTKTELPWVREAERVVQQFRLDAGLPAGGLMKDLWPKLLGADMYVPADIVGNISMKTLKEVKLARRSKNFSIGGLPREHFSGMAMLEDLGYMSSRSKHISPVLGRFHPGGVAYRTQTGRPINKVTNPEWIGLTGAQQRYFEQLLFRMSGKPKGVIHDAFDESLGNAFHWINQNLEPAVSRRILRYYAGKPAPTSKAGQFGKKVMLDVANARLPEIDPMMKLAFTVQHNVIRAMLGGKLSTAIANSAITVNTAAAEGTPQAIKGVFRMMDRKWQKAIKDTDLDIVWHQINETNLWDKHVLAGVDDKVAFRMFNFTEVLGKGIAGQLAFERTMLKQVNAKTGKSYKGIEEWLIHATPDQRRDTLLSARWASIDQTHLYGMLGRAPAADSPFVRPASTLLSFGMKQSEFLWRQMKRDPSGIIRYFALSGWMINKADDYLGVDATPFVGLGFLPMTKSLDGLPVIASPELQTFLDFTAAAGLLSRDDPRGAVSHLKAAKVGLAGLLGLPVGATRDYAEAWQEWNAGTRPYGAEKFVESSKPEAIRRIAFSRSTLDRKRSELNTSMAASERKYDFEMDMRASRWVEAALGMEADSMNDAAALMLKPIIIDGQEVPIDGESMNKRIANKMKNRTQPADVQRWSDVPATMRFLYGPRMEAYEKLLNREVR